MAAAAGVAAAPVWECTSCLWWWCPPPLPPPHAVLCYSNFHQSAEDVTGQRGGTCQQRDAAHRTGGGQVAAAGVGWPQVLPMLVLCVSRGWTFQGTRRCFGAASAWRPTSPGRWPGGRRRGGATAGWRPGGRRCPASERRGRAVRRKWRMLSRAISRDEIAGAIIIYGVCPARRRRRQR